MDLTLIEQRLVDGEALKVKYRYPCVRAPGKRGPEFGVRSDKLVDVSLERNRFYTLFRGTTPVWLEEEDVIEIAEDDGVYEELAE